MKIWQFTAVIVVIAALFYFQNRESKKQIENAAKYALYDGPMSFSFDSLTYGDTAVHRIEFKNSGDVPLKLIDVKPTCGCTATNWSKDPIPVGENGYIDVEFVPAQKGGHIQRKTITVYANTFPPQFGIQFHARVF